MGHFRLLLCFTGLLMVGLPTIGAQGRSADTEPDRRFLTALRTSLAEKTPIADSAALRTLFAETSFPQTFHGAAIAIYQPGERRMLVVRQGGQDYEDLRNAIDRAMLHPRIDRFDLKDPSRSRIQLDFILEPPEPIDLERLSVSGRGHRRLELGVDGLRLTHDGEVKYVLPGDAFVHGLRGMRRLRSYVQRRFGGAPIEEIAFERFRTASFVSYQDRWLPLYRGYPVIGTIDAEDLLRNADAGARYVVDNQQKDGRFLYYYDALKDSYLDHLHSKREPEINSYYNILRHSGGIALLLDHYEQFGDPVVLPAIEAALAYLLDQIVHYPLPDGGNAAYVFYNRKAKLGGTALALYTMCRYHRLTGIETYDPTAQLLQNHIVAQIRESGEFYYYHVYPGRAKDDARLFSLYYPGEALVALATCYPLVDDEAQASLRENMRRALRFLIEVRPEIHADKLASLPLDCWLMMAINALWNIPEMQQDAYRDFLFDEADSLVEHMYSREDALYPDYVGSFYYDYGDRPYPDGYRGEGLTAALELALKLSDHEHAERYREALKALGWATSHLVNTPESVYAVPRPDRAVGGIRFKFTRQWFRVDTIQHVGAFFLKFARHWDDDSVFDPTTQ
jgi:hypothetical protein